MNQQALREQLRALPGHSAYFDPMEGNHGDSLISVAARTLLGDLGIAIDEDVNTAQSIILSGGGSMAAGWNGLKKLSDYSRRFPDKALTVLPSSFQFGQLEPAGLLRGRNAQAWLWAREPASLALLEETGFSSGIHLGLEHDLALGLAGSSLVSRLATTANASSILIVERDDWESPTGRRRPLAPPGLSFIPERIRTAVRKRVVAPLRRRQDRDSVFNRAALRFLASEGVDIIGRRIVCADISLPEVIDFYGFLESIARAEVIVTTRLHVAIVAHLIGRRCYLVEGNYHKYRGVYDYSLGDGGTALLRWTGEELVPRAGP